MAKNPNAHSEESREEGQNAKEQGDEHKREDEPRSNEVVIVAANSQIRPLSTACHWGLLLTYLSTNREGTLTAVPKFLWLAGSKGKSGVFDPQSFLPSTTGQRFQRVHRDTAGAPGMLPVAASRK